MRVRDRECGGDGERENSTISASDENEVQRTRYLLGRSSVTTLVAQPGNYSGRCRIEVQHINKTSFGAISMPSPSTDEILLSASRRRVHAPYRKKEGTRPGDTELWSVKHAHIA